MNILLLRQQTVGRVHTGNWWPGMIENGRTRTISEILANTDHDIEAVVSFKNLRTLNDNTNDETGEIKAGITAANTAYCPLHITFRCKQIHRNNKIRLYETLMKPVQCYGKCNMDHNTNDTQGNIKRNLWPNTR
jgi:hypothetical protein